jgi:hypothetical protein
VAVHYFAPSPRNREIGGFFFYFNFDFDLFIYVFIYLFIYLLLELWREK